MRRRRSLFGDTDQRSPGNDGPLIQASIDKSTGTKSKGYTIQGGRLVTPIALGSQHNGLTVSQASGTQLWGGTDLVAWEAVPLTDPVRNRIPASVRQKTLRCDLKRLDPGRKFADTEAGGGPQLSTIGTAQCELMFGSTVLTPAAYPPLGSWLTTTGGGTDTFNFNDPVPATWSAANMQAPNWISAEGYFQFDNYTLYARINPLSPPTTSATFHDTFNMPCGTGRRFRFYNILEALSPGTFYIDRSSGFVYAVPPAEIRSQQVVYSMLDVEPLTLTGVSNVVLSGLNIRGGRRSAIKLIACSNITLKNCHIQGCGMHGIEADTACANITIDSCTFEDCGGAGVQIGGGSRTNLSSSGHLIVNSQFRRCNRKTKTCLGGVHFLGGHGHTVRGCLFESLPSQAIYMRLLNPDVFETRNASGVLIEKCTFRSCMQASGDLGCIYSDSEWGGAGVVIQDNLFINNTNLGFSGNVVGVYADNGMSGWTVQRNLFANSDYGVQVNGGRSISIDSNVFVSCSQRAVQFNDTLVSQPSFVSGRMDTSLSDIPHGAQPWLGKFAFVHGIALEPSDAERAKTKGCTVSNSLYQNTTFIDWSTGLAVAITMTTNVSTGNAGVVLAGPNATIVPGGAAAALGLATVQSQFLG